MTAPETDGVLRFPRDEIGASVGEEGDPPDIEWIAPVKTWPCPVCGESGHSAADQHCSFCHAHPAIHKVGEEGHGELGFHNLTNYLCCHHFTLIVGDCSRFPTYAHAEES